MLIDKEGKLFGVVNIIDFLVILSVLIVVPFGYYWWKIQTISQEKTISAQDYVLVEKAEINKYKKELAEYKKELAEYKIKINHFLKEHKRLRKYFK